MPSLSGITVLDLSHALAGPFSTLLLTELGAHVIKLEPPGGDHFRPSHAGGTFAAINRNKNGICLDLKLAASRPVMERLIRSADIFVQSFTPGTIDRLGYGYEAVSALNPRIIYCSISGFGETGPYRELRGYDTVIQAISGIMMSTGEPDRPPVRVGPSVIDMGTGSYLAIAVLDALRERDQHDLRTSNDQGKGSGEDSAGASYKGPRLEFNLLETALSWMAPQIAGYSLTGKLPQRQGSALDFHSPYQVFAASDGYLFIGASTERAWQRLCGALGRLDLLDDERFVDRASRVTNRAALSTIIEAYLATTTVKETVDKVRAAGVPCAPVNTLQDILEDPHVAARGVISKHPGPQTGDVMQVRSPIGKNLDENMRPAPALGQHTREVLTQLGYNAAEIDALFAAGVALNE
ncbi:MAG: crotonobetainyl-CoA:carnitine CoA-transferase CaiB-like acyl-CoA transferase [Gammaproteobacteria bacterium]|jgi:crotonobetainyl-CoA:carnitine CoA-transferase CaiB-like acyl-CoA transferase